MSQLDFIQFKTVFSTAFCTQTALFKLLLFETELADVQIKTYNEDGDITITISKQCISLKFNVNIGSLLFGRSKLISLVGKLENTYLRSTRQIASS